MKLLFWLFILGSAIPKPGTSKFVMTFDIESFIKKNKYQKVDNCFSFSQSEAHLVHTVSGHLVGPS